MHRRFEQPSGNLRPLAEPIEVRKLGSLHEQLVFFRAYSMSTTLAVFACYWDALTPDYVAEPNDLAAHCPVYSLTKYLYIAVA